MNQVASDGNARDDGVIDEICGYLTGETPQSFFLFAGAGSGKTRTLIEVLRRLTGLVPGHEPGSDLARRLRARGQAIRVITYTKNATAIVQSRLGMNTLTKVSTIHSFAWDLVQGFDDDIRECLLALNAEKRQEVEQEASARRKGATARDTEKLRDLVTAADAIRVAKRFVYNPDRNTFGAGALQHDDVLSLAARLLLKTSALARILADRHPIILVDESQDTMVRVVDCLRELVQRGTLPLTLGLLGDHRQRVYFDGHPDLSSAIPSEWPRPALKMNHRSRARIVEFINRVWEAEVEGRTQTAAGGRQFARAERTGGVVRCYVGDAKLPAHDKIAVERACALRMADASGTQAWRDHEFGYRVLALEHKLAARRAGFLHVWNALEAIDKTGVRQVGDAPDGSDAGPAFIRVFMRELAALAACVDGGRVDEFAALEVLRRFGALDGISNPLHDPRRRLERIAAAVRAFSGVLAAGNPTLRDLAASICEHDLFELHGDLKLALKLATCESSPPGAGDASSSSTTEWENILDVRWDQLLLYRRYLAGGTRFGTHQGVKGSEYEHVMVIMDDEDAGGHMFSYDKLLGAERLSKTDRENEAARKDTVIDRTLRLLYVTCSRARDSLALVYWSRNPATAKSKIAASGWFVNGEVETMPVPPFEAADGHESAP
jgi:DNA helicase II / ATP-dependent DNA helicase PcrA